MSAMPMAGLAAVGLSPAAGTSSTAPSSPASVIGRLDLEKPLTSLDATPDGRYLLAAGREVIKVLARGDIGDLSVESNVRPVRGGLDVTTLDAKFGPLDGSHGTVASASANGVVVLWKADGRAWRRAETYREHMRTVNRVAWSPVSEHVLASGSQDSTVRFWDLRAAASVATVEMHSPARELMFDPATGSAVAVGLDDGRVRVWDLVAGRVRADVTGHHGPVLALSWHPTQERVLASAGRDRALVVWDLGASLRPIQTAQVATSVGAIAWRSSFPFQIVTCPHLMDQHAYVWNLKRPSIPIYAIGGHRDVVTAAVWAADGSELLTSSKDGSVRVHKVDRAERCWDRVRAASVSWNALGELVAVSESLNRSALYVAEPALHTSVPAGSLSAGVGGVVVGDDTHSQLQSSTTSSLAESIATSGFGGLRLSKRLSTQLVRPAGAVQAAAPVLTASSTLVGSATLTNSSSTNNLALQNSASSTGSSGGSSASSIYNSSALPSLNNSVTSSAIAPTYHSSQLSSASAASLPTAGSLLTASASSFLPATQAHRLLHLYTSESPSEFDGRQFVQLASLYSLDSGDFERSCATNAQAASLVGAEQAAQTWRILLSLFTPTAAAPVPPVSAEVAARIEMQVDAELEKLSGSQAPQHNGSGGCVDLRLLAPELEDVGGAGGAAWRTAANDDDEDRPGGSDAVATAAAPSMTSAPAGARGSRGARRRGGRLGREGGFDDETFRPHESLMEDLLFPRGADDAPAAAMRRPNATALPSMATALGTGDLYLGGDDPVAIGEDIFARRGSPPLRRLHPPRGARRDLREVRGGSDDDDSDSDNSLSSDEVPSQSGSRRRIVGSGRAAAAGGGSGPVAAAPGHNSSPSRGSAAATAAEAPRVIAIQPPPLLTFARGLVDQLLEHYANQGDVLMCVTLAMVLGEERYNGIRSTRFLHWYAAYHELLLKLRQFTVATRLLKACPVDSLRKRNQVATTMYSSCAKCGKALERPGACEKCHRVPNTCILCHEVVRGVFVWCQGCGHGGHLRHMRDWFASRSECPGGCGHLCTFET